MSRVRSIERCQGLGVYRGIKGKEYREVSMVRSIERGQWFGI